MQEAGDVFSRKAGLRVRSINCGGAQQGRGSSTKNTQNTAKVQRLERRQQRGDDGRSSLVDVLFTHLTHRIHTHRRGNVTRTRRATPKGATAASMPASPTSPPPAPPLHHPPPSRRRQRAAPSSSSFLVRHASLLFLLVTAWSPTYANLLTPISMGIDLGNHKRCVFPSFLLFHPAPSSLPPASLPARA